jgi:hypothetical protein
VSAGGPTWRDANVRGVHLRKQILSETRGRGVQRVAREPAQIDHRLKRV